MPLQVWPSFHLFYRARCRARQLARGMTVMVFVNFFCNGPENINNVCLLSLVMNRTTFNEPEDIEWTFILMGKGVGVGRELCELPWWTTNRVG